MSLTIEGHIIPVVNTHASNIDRARMAFDPVAEKFHRQIGRTVFTSENSDETIGRILEHSGPDDLLVVIGGDKTGAEVGQAAAENGASVLPFWGGNGNDTARDLYESRLARPGLWIFDHGRLSQVHIFDTVVNGEHVASGVNYASVGITGDLAGSLNGAIRQIPGYRVRTLRALYETAFLAPRLGIVKPFEAQTTTGSTPLPVQRYVEWSFNNAASMAKYFRTPFSLIEPRMSVTQAASLAEFISVGYAALSTVAPHQDVLDAGDSRTYRITDGRPVLQADGDVLRQLAPGDEYTISLSKRSFSAVTTRR